MSRRKGSEIWSFMEKGIGGDTATCIICKNTFKYSKGSTSNLMKHLKTKHPFEFGGSSEDNEAAVVAPNQGLKAEAPKTIMTQQTLFSAVDRTKHYPKDSAKKKELDGLVLRMVTKDLQPISVVEDEGFRDLVKGLNTRYELPSRRQISRELLPAKYLVAKNILRTELDMATDICVTTDIWTSRQTEGYITVTAHYVLPSWELKTSILGTPRMTNDHTAKNIAASLKEIFDEWGIGPRISAVVTDNAANMVSAVKEHLKMQHMGCFAHTLNLVVKDALHRNEGTKRVIEQVKSIVRYFHSSVKGADRLKEIQQRNGDTQRKLINDVETRWNSTLQMLRRYVQEHQSATTALCMLSKAGMCVSDVDVEVMRTAVEALEPFEMATEEMSAEKRTTLSKLIPIVRQLQECLSEMSSANPLAQELQNQMRRRFGSYQDSFLLTASTLLDPRFKKLPFTDEDALKKGMDQLKSMLEELCA